MRGKPELLFIAPWFLFPADSGGKLRTADILKYLNKLEYSVTLLSPRPENDPPRDAELAEICDRFISWPEPKRGRFFEYTRLLNLASPLPIPVATDQSAIAKRTIQEALSKNPAVVVVDFVHTHVLMPEVIGQPSVVFTHNVEAEIFERHARVAEDLIRRAIWRNQHQKMMRFEKQVLNAYDRVIAVSERDRRFFNEQYGLDPAVIRDIPTGLDMARYECRINERDVPPDAGHLVFTAAMGSAANIDAIEWMMDAVWEPLRAKRPKVKFTIVGRNPPKDLIQKAAAKGYDFTFTGSVPSVEPFVHDADLFVIPLRVGGGTRLKVIEAVAMGSPIVSTDIGVEGIALMDGEHYANANTESEFAEKIDDLLNSPKQRKSCAQSAYDYISRNFGAPEIARRFQAICNEAVAASAR